MADFDFERWTAWNGKEVSTLSLDSEGRAHPYGTVGTWQFEACERDRDYRERLWAHPWGVVAEANRADMPYGFDVSYITSESTSEGILDGYATSFEECEDIFRRLWGRVKRHKICNWSLPYEWHSYCEHPFVDIRETTAKRKVA